MKVTVWDQDSVRALPRYLLVLAAVSALALLARAAAPSLGQAAFAVLPADPAHGVDVAALSPTPVPSSPSVAARFAQLPSSWRYAHSSTTARTTVAVDDSALAPLNATRSSHDAMIAALAPHTASPMDGSGSDALRREDVSASMSRFKFGPREAGASTPGR